MYCGNVLAGRYLCNGLIRRKVALRRCSANILIQTAGALLTSNPFDFAQGMLDDRHNHLNLRLTPMCLKARVSHHNIQRTILNKKPTKGSGRLIVKTCKEPEKV